MSIAKKLGKQFEQVKDEVQIKKSTVDLGQVRFDIKIRVPLKKEVEDMNARILSPNEERVAALYEQIAGPMRKTLDEGGEEFIKALNEKKQSIKVLDDDLVVDGVSLRQVAHFTAVEQIRVEEYFRLLVSETGEPVNESYEQISGEFPEFVIKEIVSAIQAAIAPDYKAAKKN